MTERRAVVGRIRALDFPYDGDTAALRELERRLAATARTQSIVTYSDLVKGIIFHIPGVLAGKSIELGGPDWTDLHRAILGNYSGRISCDSYGRAGFLASAGAVSKSSSEPSEGFRTLVEDLGLLPTGNPNEHSRSGWRNCRRPTIGMARMGSRRRPRRRPL